MHKSSKEVWIWVNEFFFEINNAKNIGEISQLENRIPDKYRMNTTHYPQLNFSISAEEIIKLQNEELISKDLHFKHSLFNSTDAMTKLLIALAWKNGDLYKVHHIIKGIQDIDDTDQTNGLVFYQFGKYLTKKEGEPIIDQHVLRAFEIFQLKTFDEKKLDEYRKREEVTLKQKKLINEYKKWLRKGLHGELTKANDWSYHIDKLLFGVGKTIKYRKIRQKNGESGYLSVIA